jgi:DhnA family fructose-bisphosphate aldolase class Ia
VNNKQYRLKELLDPRDGRSLVLDASNGLVLGALPGLEHFTEALKPLLPLLDGVVTSPGQAQNLGTRMRQDAALLVCADWTNALRGEDFVLPPETIQYIPLIDSSDALELGANALVTQFILGHEEQIEAECLKRTVSLSLNGIGLGMPVIVNVQPVGPRVVLRNKAVELGVSYALEGGADGMVIPWPGISSFETILGMTSGMPVWVKPVSLHADSAEIADALRMGAVGLWLKENVLAEADPVSKLQELRNLMHTAGV